MRAIVLASGLAVLAVPPAQQLPLEGIRAPAFAADGRLAVSVGGDLWILQPDRTGGFSGARAVTTGAAWDRDPAWTPDGRGLVFASDRGGTFALWRIDLRADTSAAPQRLTASTEHDTEPDIASDGTIVFTRGVAGDTDLWVRLSDGTERHLTYEAGAEREPAWSPDARRVAYVAVRNGRPELRVRELAGRETTVEADRQVHGPAWSPDGERIAFGVVEGDDAGIWTVAADGRYEQAAGTVAGVPAWSPDGAWIVFAEADPRDVGYNGDPERGERLAGDVFAVAGRLQRIPAPRPPAVPGTVDVEANSDRVARNAGAFDRAWARVGRLYLGIESAETPIGPPAEGESELAAAWRTIGRRHRPAALVAGDDEALRDAIYAALRERPARPEPTGRAAVSSAHPLATAAGLEILELGGNVVDAAVAVSFALGVVEPDASGVGGYGAMLIHLARMAEPTAIEFMTTVPEAASLDHTAAISLPRSGPGVATVPGTVAGMELAWRRYGSGRVSWARLLEPAIRLAENGFVLDDALPTTLRREREGFERHESSRRLFFREGRPLARGDTLRNPDLGWVLRELARGGADAFYRGTVGERMVQDLRRGGNLMTMEDLHRYSARERRPVRTSYRGHDVYSGPPPVSGGAALAGKLNLLELVSPGRSMTEDAGAVHALIEAWKFQPPTNSRVADPDIWPVDVTPFESKDTARVRWRCFLPDRAAPPKALERDDCGRGISERDATEARPAAPSDDCRSSDPECRATGTTAYVVADAEGNIVSVTQTLGTWGGNFYVSPGLGFLYNDKLRSYSGSPNGFNARVSHARNTTVIAPTIVFRGAGTARRPWFGVGAAGNSWITAAVYQMVVGIIDHGLGPQQALELPRFLPTAQGIQIEDGFAPRTLRELEQMGHTFHPITSMGELRMGYGAAIVMEQGQVRAGADPRRSGTGGAVQ